MAAAAVHAQRPLLLLRPQHSLSRPLFRTPSSISRRLFFSFRAVAAATSSSSSPAVAPPRPSVDCTDGESQQSSSSKWQPFRKKKVVMQVGYVGSNYRGLQKQKDEHSLSTVEGELESAIYKAGGILDSNLGNLHKIAWSRSSRTDKGVHSLATTISLKMEIPESAWKCDPFGIHLASHINAHLPGDIRIFSILPSPRSFDPRRECSIRKYSYLLPEVLILRGNNYVQKKLPVEVIRPEMLAQVESEAVLAAVNEFYSSEMLPEVAKFFDPSRPPWKDWVEKLDEHTPLPDSQLDEVRKAWRSWKEAFDNCRSVAAS